MKRMLVLVGLAACDGVFSLPNAQPTGPLPDARPTVTGQLVFATSQRYRGCLLGGVEGADAMCAQHAASAGLPGEFKAWLSQVGSSAADRLTHSTTPYVLVDGTKVADSWEDLVRFDLLHAIDQDEHGSPLHFLDPVEAAVWTYTALDGMAYPWTPGGTMTDNPRWDCAAWSSIDSWGEVGFWNETGTFWTASNSAHLCSETKRLYCFQQ
jgi:hypothetical protein